MHAKRSADRELTEELQSFINLRAEEYVRSGMSPEAAHRAALLDMGGVQQVTENVRDVRAGVVLDTMVQDVCYAARSLRHAPSFAIAAILTLALGIGATTAIFSALEAVILRPFSVVSPERQVSILDVWRGEEENVSTADFLAWRDRSRSFDGMAAESFSSVTFVDGNSADRYTVGRVTADYFSALGAHAAIGRTLDAADEQPASAMVAVLSDGVWRSRYGGDRSVIGRVVQLSGESYTIVGVMPEGFDPALQGEQLWTPLPLGAADRSDRDMHSLLVLARVKAGVPSAQAQRDVSAISRQLDQELPGPTKEAMGARVVSLREANVGDYTKRLYTIMGAVLLVLLIACANVSNLLLARGNARAKELALRAAIGAGRLRIVRQLLTESLLLAIVAAAIGCGLGALLIRAFVKTAPADIPRLQSASLNPAVLLFAFLIALVCAMTFGLLPALRASRLDLQRALRDGARTVRGSARDGLRSMLVAGEIALALTLLVGAGLLIRSAIKLDRVDTGFAWRGVLTARVAVSASSSSNAPLIYADEFQRLTDEVRRAPDVRDAAVASQAPLQQGASSLSLAAEGRLDDKQAYVQSRLHVVSADYFKTLELPIEQGRAFGPEDRRGSPRVMIISRKLANQLFPGANPIGKRVSCCERTPTDPSWKTVVGVAGDVHQSGPASPVDPEFYIPLSQAPADIWGWTAHAMTIVVRGTRDDPAPALHALRVAVSAVDKTAPIYGVRTMEENRGRAMAQARFNMLLLVSLGALGLLLSAAGVYSVIAYFVNLRAPEVGIRIALGAKPKDVVGLFVRQGMQPIVVGAFVGVAGALAATRLLAASLFNVTATDPITYVGVLATILAVGLLATLIPAWRATRVDPLRALAS